MRPPLLPSPLYAGERGETDEERFCHAVIGLIEEMLEDRPEQKAALVKRLEAEPASRRCGGTLHPPGRRTNPFTPSK